MRDEFLLKLAHDMGGALSAIMGYASVLEDEDADRPLGDRQRRCVVGIMDGAEHMNALIARMRDHAVAQADPFEP